MTQEETNQKLALLQKVLNEKLLEACEEGDYEKACGALEQGADVNCRNDEGWTPIHIATHCFYYEIINLLLRKNAYINSTTPRGDTALSIARICEERGNFMMSNFLTQHGASECPRM